MTFLHNHVAGIAPWISDCEDGGLSVHFRYGHPAATSDGVNDIAHGDAHHHGGVDRQPGSQRHPLGFEARNICFETDDASPVRWSASQRRLAAMGSRDHPTAPVTCSTSCGERRLIGSIRRECLDHIVSSARAHCAGSCGLQPLFYNGVERHLSLDKDAPSIGRFGRLGQLAAQPVLGGIYHQYDGFVFGRHKDLRPTKDEVDLGRKRALKMERLRGPRRACRLARGNGGPSQQRVALAQTPIFLEQRVAGALRGISGRWAVPRHLGNRRSRRQNTR